MPRKDPSKKIDILGRPDATPVEDVAKFIESKISVGMYKIVKNPVWDSVGESLENFYLNARLDHHSMMRQKAELLEQQRIEGIKNTSRIYRMNQTQAQLRNSFVKVNVFLREFEDKRKTALKKGSEQLEIQNELRSATANIQRDLSELRKFRDQIKATSDEYEPYESVLEDVVRQTSAFNSVKELMDRCDALMLAQVEINSLSDKKIGELEIMRKRLVTVAKAAALQVLGLKNALSSLDRLYEAARTACLKWERILSAAKNAVNEDAYKKERVFDGINQIYRLLCQRRSLYAALPYEDVGERLEFIRNEVELLQEVLQVLKSKHDKNKNLKPESRC